MEFETVLKQALADVEAAEVPADLKEFAFAEAVKHYAARMGSTEALPARAQSNGETGGVGSPLRRPPGSDIFDKVAAETGVSREDLEQVFYMDGDVPAINQPARKLGVNKADRHRAIALLLIGMRHYGLDETEVALDVVRDACVRMSTYDSANFSNYMGGVSGITLTGPRGKKVLRPRPDAKAKFKEKIASILGTSDTSID